MNRLERYRTGVLGMVVLALGGTGCATVGTAALKGSAYYDTRGLPTGTVTTTIVHAGRGSRFFAFSDIESDSAFPRYLEANLSQRVAGRVAVLVEYNRDFNATTGTHRFGATYLVPLPQYFSRDRLSFKYTPVSTHGRGAQYSIAGSKLFGRDMYVEGFWDYNSKPDRVVTEWQFGRRVAGNVYGVVEYRHSGFRTNPTSLGIGLEWRIR